LAVRVAVWARATSGTISRHTNGHQEWTLRGSQGWFRGRGGESMHARSLRRSCSSDFGQHARRSTQCAARRHQADRGTAWRIGALAWPVVVMLRVDPSGFV